MVGDIYTVCKVWLVMLVWCMLGWDAMFSECYSDEACYTWLGCDV